MSESRYSNQAGEWVTLPAPPSEFAHYPDDVKDAILVIEGQLKLGRGDDEISQKMQYGARIGATVLDKLYPRPDGSTWLTAIRDDMMPHTVQYWQPVLVEIHPTAPVPVVDATRYDYDSADTQPILLVEPLGLREEAGPVVMSTEQSKSSECLEDDEEWIFEKLGLS